jgi:hypothetical protein
MKNEYNTLISKIRATEPLLENGDALSAAIMNRIERLPMRERGPHRRLILAGRASLTAAVMLIGLLISELSIARSLPQANRANRANISEYLSPYESMPKEDIIKIIAERRAQSEAMIQLTIEN